MAEGKLPPPTSILLFLLRHRALIFNRVHCHPALKKKKKMHPNLFCSCYRHVTSSGQSAPSALLLRGTSCGGVFPSFASSQPSRTTKWPGRWSQVPMTLGPDTYLWISPCLIEGNSVWFKPQLFSCCFALCYRR